MENSIYRILDANINRAREGLRTIEEYFRFIRNDRIFTERLKQTRHRLIEIENRLNRFKIISSRDSESDIGKNIINPSAGNKKDIFDLISANFKRLQESLRVIAEYSNIIDTKATELAEKLRFEVYTLEKQFYQLIPRNRFEKVKLYLLIGSDVVSKDKIVPLLSDLLDAGLDAVQLREKYLPDREFLELAEQMAELCKQKGKIFIVNDRADIAQIVDADGLHLGQTDLPIEAVRKILSVDKILGISTHNTQELENAIKSSPTYISLGPAFPTTIKPELKPSEEFIRTGISRLKELNIPSVLIGGITVENIHKLIEMGATSFALSSGILKTPHPAKSVETLIEAIRK